MAARGIKSYLADYSVDGPPIANSSFDFEKKYLGLENTDQFVTLQDWVEKKAPGQTDFILQMDIERAQYAVLLQTPADLLRRFRIIVVEFHDLEFIFDDFTHDLIKLVFLKLLTDFDVVHIHPNNCSPSKKYKGFEVPPMMEFTFHRKDRVTSRANTLASPIHWIGPASLRTDIVLPRCWYP